MMADNLAAHIELQVRGLNLPQRNKVEEDTQCLPLASINMPWQECVYVHTIHTSQTVLNYPLSGFTLLWEKQLIQPNERRKALVFLVVVEVQRS